MAKKMLECNSQSMDNRDLRDANLSISEKYGVDYYASRIAVEKEREAEFNAVFSTKFTFFKIHLIRPLQRFFLHATGLYRKGHDELLSAKVRYNDIVLGNRLPKEFDGFRILHLSDLHIDIDPDLVGALSEKISRLQFDLCVMTGDYRNKTVGDYRKTVELMLELRKSIKTPAFLVLGNHDFLAMVPEFAKGGYKTLINESVIIRRGNASISICGVDDPVIFKTDDVHKALAGAEGAVKILLSHSARVWRKARDNGADILLCGHTHGGQICLPGGKALIINDCAPKAMRRGAWEKDGLVGYTSCGCGASGLPIRLNCPSEIVVHRLKVQY